MKIKEAAVLADITVVMMSFIVSGKRNASIVTAKKLAEATGTDPIIWVDPARSDERRIAIDAASISDARRPF